MAGAAKKIVAASALFLSCAALLAFVFDEGNSNQSPRPDELLSPLEVGLYAVRAERQSADYDKKAERQIAFATGNDNSASAENTLAEKEEKRARQSAFLAADVKSRIDHVLEDGKDQVNQETKLKAKAASLQEQSDKLLADATAAKDEAASLEAKYYSGMDSYNSAVADIDTASKKAQGILDQVNAQSLVLAEVATQYAAATSNGQDPDSAAALALKAQLEQAQTDLAAVEAQKDQALADSEEAGKLADQYQPVIIQAEKDKRAADFEFQKFAQATNEADQLQNRADALIARAENIDTLVDETQTDLAKKRKEFEHYKNRAQTEMAISLQAEDKEALLRKEARDARAKAAELSDKARALRALAQKGVNHVLENELPPSGAADSDA
jgi:hypothetical protein